MAAAAPVVDDNKDGLESSVCVVSVNKTFVTSGVGIIGGTVRIDDGGSLLSGGGADISLLSTTNRVELLFIILIFILFCVMNHDRTKVCLFFINIVFMNPVSITSECLARIGRSLHR